MSGTRLLVAFYEEKKSKSDSQEDYQANRVAFEGKLRKGVKMFENRTGLTARSCLISPGMLMRLFPDGQAQESLTIDGIVVESRPWVLRADMHIGEDV